MTSSIEETENERFVKLGRLEQRTQSDARGGEGVEIER